MGRPTAVQPEFARRSPLLRSAYATAFEAHHGPARRGDTDIDHPVAVAELLVEFGIEDEELLAAAFLHDVIEDTDTDPDAIGDEFGTRVQHLVEVMTENPEIEPYEDRKAEHRERVSRDADASAIYAADKLARCRQLRRDGEDPDAQRLEHYRETLELLRETHPDLPLLPELTGELTNLKRGQAP